MDDTQRIGWQKRILLFLTSQCITLFGSTLVKMALVWYATMQTASGVWVAAFTVAFYLPQFLISFIGGVWADRYHRKKLIIGADMLIAFATFIMALAIPHISSDPALLGSLLVMSVVRSFGTGIQKCFVGRCQKKKSRRSAAHTHALMKSRRHGDFPMYLEIRSGRWDNLQYLPYSTSHLHCIFHILSVEGCYMRVGCILLFAYSLARQFSP